ncbi:MDMPI N domain containing protein, partial [Streptomyces virginiae]
MNGPPQSPDDGYERLGGQARIPGPRGAADDLDPGHAPRSLPPLPSMPSTPVEPAPVELPPVAPPPPSHAVLKSLLGAWALAACSAEETQAVED